MTNPPDKKLLILGVLIWITCITLFVQSCSVDKPEEIASLENQLPATIDYNLHVRPILSDKCFFCHGPDKNKQEAGLELATREGALAPLEEHPDKFAIVPRNLAKSELYHRIISTEEEVMMPPRESNRELTAYEKAILLKWIEQGAEYKPHWSFIKPEKKPLPQVKEKEWTKNAIDYFVLHKLEENGLKTSPEADKETLLRRVTLDLTGLPPTLEETDAFLSDNSPNAYEKVVDRLLQSPHYGEKMAVDWLDVARFADTHGYTVDRYRPMWPWRDWVIKAFNENIPYDRFITWQMAGDLLPNPTREQKLATGFNRNHAQNVEGGIVNEEFRVEYVADRTNTLGTAFLGVTMECARCHDHKYDPISQKDYYSVFSFFNNVEEAGQISWDDAMPVPTMLLTEAKHDSLIQFFDEQLKGAENDLTHIIENEKQEFEEWKMTHSKKPLFNPAQGLQAHFTFDKLVKDAFINEVSANDKGTVLDPVIVPGKFGNAFQSNGDDILKLGKVGIFNRANPFSIGVWINIPKDLSKGVIFHKGNGDILYNFRGYFLNLREGKVELLMAHTWPYNNIVKITEKELPKEQWLHLLMTYDGSSKADGLKLYIDGKEAPMITEKDNLYKDILLTGEDQPGLQVGADWRGVGFKNGLVDDLLIYTRELTSLEASELVQVAQKGLSVQPQTQDEKALANYYFANFSPAYQKGLKELEKLREEKNKVVEEIPEIMVMEEMEKPRSTYLLKRGQYDNYGDKVNPDVPNSILPYAKNLPKNRLGLAKWLTHPDNPLTARVAVNRYWQIYFGKGLHKNANDFGNQGGLPSHPELLDYLAVNFRESGWDVKALQKLMVMSATYRQSSYASPALQEKDPENILLARGPAFRLTAEMVRDNALAASGLLVPKMGGPSVKPYQPEGLWAVNMTVYKQDTGQALYRRSLYTFWKRTNPPPSMNTFDAPDRSNCTVQRQQTSTPLQALVLLNDPQFVEAAKVLAERAGREYNTEKEQIVYMYRLLTGRKPTEKEVAILQKLYSNEQEKFKQYPDKMKGWLSAGEYKFTGDIDTPALAAGTVVASTILNSDAFLTRR
ncbi:DUF1553 domain-containing protein [Rhodocytophaga aerolata]|uniref:DUF1553 domain-containing protein n=1 Tax=Rhodocytophaga aerolata TaxID=455078 RepID=A0ABT8RGD8_9BACT|nr:DUF1553 domain-containing protein [Rhodocytophaga aerolata]MDO1451177.1 DUF1553 domain-containing protein [Rhodocytophaga aerolata]